MTSISKYDYLFSEAPDEAHRLNIQQDTFDNLYAPHNLIFDPDIDLSSLHNVLDVAVGTGVWLKRLKERGQAGQKLPSDAKLAGCDIQLDNLDPELKKDPQATFYIQDVLEPFPESEHSKYDFVQLRLVLMAMNVTTYRKALENLYKVLKPGGLIQTIEFEPRPPETGKAADKWLRNLLTDIWQVGNKDPVGICRDMQEHLESVQFEKVKVIHKDWPWGIPVAKAMGLSEEVAASNAVNASFAMKALRPVVVRLAEQGKPLPGNESAEQFDASWELCRKHYLEDGHTTTLVIGLARRPIDLKN